jgi:MFS family permease
MYRMAASTPPAVGGPVRPAPARWLVLTGFALLVGSTQLLWLSFAPISTDVGRVLDVSDGAVGDLAAVNPLLYVLLAIPAGRWADRRFGAALAAGALCTAGGAVLRTVHPEAYGWVLAGQLVVSVGQPLVLNATTKLPARYFPPEQRTLAISVASAAQFVGILAAALGVAPLFDRGGLARVLDVHAAVAVVAAVAVLLALRVRPAHTQAQAPHEGLGWLRHDRLIWKLAGLLFVGVGVFNAVATWLDSILVDFGLTGRSGTLIAVMTVAGIAGAAVLPGAAARYDRRRALLMTATLLTAAGFGVIALVHSALVIGIVLAVVGFVLLAGLPVALDWSELESGPGRAATATGFLLLAGNLGGVVLVLVVQLAIGDPYAGLAVLALIAVPGLLLASRLPDHSGSHEQDDG